MRVLEFEHANKPGAKISIFSEQIFGVMDMPEGRCVALVGPGGALVPVAGSHAQILARIQESKTEKEKRGLENE